MPDYYLPTPTWVADGVDITGYVSSFRSRRGWNVISNETGRNQIQTAGDLLLDNHDRYWTQARLSSLDIITARADSVVMGMFKVQSYKVNAPTQSVRLTLGPVTNYDLLVDFDFSSHTLAPALLTSVDVTITPETPFAGYHASAGWEYSDTLKDFLYDFGILFDSYVYEEADGSLRAINPSTENRTPVFEIDPLSLRIDRQFTNSQYRQRFRRDAQVVRTLGTNLNSANVLIPENTNLIADAGAVITKTGDRYETRIDLLALAGRSDDSASFSHYTVPDERLEVDTPGANPVYPILRNNGPRKAGPDRQGAVMRDTNRIVNNPTTEQQEAFDLPASWQTRNDETFTLWFFDASPSIREHRHFANVDDQESVHGFVPSNAIPMSFNDLAMINPKLERYQDYIPVVARLVFPLAQPSVTQFDSMATIKPGVIVDTSINAHGLVLRQRSYVMYAEWRYSPRGMPLYEVHLVSFEDLAPAGSPRVRYNLRDVDYNLRDVVYRDDGLAPAPLPAAPSWTAASGANLDWTINAPITAVTVPAVDSGHPMPGYVASGLPAGISFDPATRILSGTPTALGTGTITITADK